MKIIIHILLFSLLILTSKSFPADRQIVLADPEEEWSGSLKSIRELLSESYKEIGYEVIFKRLPLARGLVELANGTVDGDVARVESITKNYDVVLVNPSYFTTHIYAYYQKNQFEKAPSIEDVRNGKIGYLNGAVAVKKFISGTKHSIKVKNHTQLMNLLKFKRVDFIIPATTLPTSEKSLGKIFLLELPVYHVLTKKNQELVRKIEPVLKKNMFKKKYSNLRLTR